MSRPNDLAEREIYLDGIRAQFKVALQNDDIVLKEGILAKLNEEGYIYEAQALEYQWNNQQEKQ